MSEQSSDSCFVAMMRHYIELDSHDEDLLARLEQSEQRYSNRDVVVREGDSSSKLWVVRSGWFFSSVNLADGRRQVYRVHFPGDVIGFPDIAFRERTSTLEAATDGWLCPFPKQALDDIFIRSSRLTALLFSLGMVNQAVVLDRLRSTGRMSAKERVAQFLLELQSRLRITDPDLSSEFLVPLTQEVIGDALGLTNVYVSRTLQALVSDGLIERRPGRVNLLHDEELRRLCGFIDRYAEIDTSWFPSLRN